MPAPTPSPARSASPGGRVGLIPATKFFVRRIPLVAGSDADTQVALALEAIGPFAPGQLYYGHCPSPDGTQALVFATYRRNFSPAETEGWAAADAVLPDFAVWLGPLTPTSPAVWLHEQEGSVAAILWDGAGALPVGVLARETSGRPAGVARDELLLEARKRLGSPAAESRIFRGAAATGPLTKEGLTLTLGDRTVVLTPALLRTMDVRDKRELDGQIGRRRRDLRLWYVFAAAAAALAACVVAETGLQVSRALLARQRAQLEVSAPAVRKVEQANQLVARMEQLADQSLRPFEMLALLNTARPATLEFVRAATTGPRRMEIEAQTGNAADPHSYEQALASTPEIEGVELRDFRTSSGRTTFLVAVTFKPGFAGQGGAK